MNPAYLTVPTFVRLVLLGGPGEGFRIVMKYWELVLLVFVYIACVVGLIIALSRLGEQISESPGSHDVELVVLNLCLKSVSDSEKNGLFG